MPTNTKDKPLSVRHEAFCQAIVRGESYAQAYLSAGYTATHEAAGTAGPRLFKNVAVQARIKELRGSVAKKAQMTREELVQILSDEVRESKGKGRTNTQAVSALAKMCGWNEPEKIEMKTEVEVGPATLDMLERSASKLASTLSLSGPRTPARIETDG